MKATHGRTQRDPQRCKSIDQNKGRRNEASSITLAMLMPFLFEEPLRPRINAISTQKKFSEGTGRDHNTPLMKGKIQENFWIGGQRSSNETPMQERSPSEARAEPERSRGLRKEHGTSKGRSEAGAEPERSPSGARTEKGLRKEHGTLKGRSGSRNYIIPRPQNLPSFLGGSMLLKLTRLL